MGPEQWVNIAVGVAVIGFLWNLHRDIAGLHKGITGLHDQFAGLRERMARLEGLVEGFIGSPYPRSAPKSLSTALGGNSRGG